MPRLLSTLAMLAISLNFLGQSQREFTFKHIGLHIKIPSNYLIRDTFPKATHSKVQEILSISSSDGTNTVSVETAKRTTKTFDFEQCYRAFREQQLLIARQQTASYDTLSSTVKVDNIELHKFSTYSSNTKSFFYSAFYLGSVKNYFLIIQLDCIDKKFLDDIEKSIFACKFD